MTAPKTAFSLLHVAATDAFDAIRGDLVVIRGHVAHSAGVLRDFLAAPDCTQPGLLTVLSSEMFDRMNAIRRLCDRNRERFALAQAALDAILASVQGRPQADVRVRELRATCDAMRTQLRQTWQHMCNCEHELLAQCERVFDTAFRFDVDSAASRLAAAKLHEVRVRR